MDEEAYLLEEPVAAAVNIAAAKARALEQNPDEVVVAADTLVVVDDEILGKPADGQAARAMLERLRARQHHVQTGVVLRAAQREWAAVVDTSVHMRTYAGDEVDAYIDRGEPFDKAGGYAVQDATFRPVEQLDGCYLNVVGLPLCAVAAGLNTLGIPAAQAGPPPCSYCRIGESLVRSGS